LKKLLTLLPLCICLYANAQTSFNYNSDFKTILAKTRDTASELSYTRLLKRFNKNDTTLSNFEVLALMIGFTDKEEYKPYADLETTTAIYSLNDNGKFEQAMAKADSFLSTHPLSVKALYEKSYAFHKLNNQDSAAVYLIRGIRIFKAMRYSGDGKTVDTPMFALGPTDGQDFIHKALGASIGTMGSSRDKAGNFLDMLEAEYKDGKTAMFYFIIQHATEKMFKE
jgi:hypothetical protein